jgi:hypothetical protein
VICSKIAKRRFLSAWMCGKSSRLGLKLLWAWRRKRCADSIREGWNVAPVCGSGVRSEICLARSSAVVRSVRLPDRTWAGASVVVGLGVMQRRVTEELCVTGDGWL